MASGSCSNKDHEIKGGLMKNLIEVVVIDRSTGIREKEFSHLTGLVSEDKRTKISQYYWQSDKERALLGDIVVRMKACQVLGIRNNDLRFCTTPYGKPYIDGHLEFQFNLSHSGNYIACAFSSSPVGIDVEEMLQVNLEIARLFFSPQEYVSLMEREPSERLSYFYDLWTLKESFLKLHGQGLSAPLNTFTIQSQLSLPGEFSVLNDPECRLKQYEVTPAYKLSACTYDMQFPEEVIWLNASELCQQFLSLTDYN
jgi:4'-phosphopantetheinyl transferase